MLFLMPSQQCQSTEGQLMDKREERIHETVSAVCDGLVTGRVLKSSAGLADYGVVPVFGCAVKVSVTEVVTNAWLVCVIMAFTL